MNVERTTLLIAKLIPEERKISKIFTRDMINPENEISAFENISGRYYERISG